ncbi:hypothetical protein [Clostridium sp. CF012]|uniref:hypothetical protein n=1 Tax=Clostridium sp. CF012 TaxID=2843319 RepID=UPI001C0AD400|nr:hypothetical protein [Clostridium sp. CF012]MBU3145971.1 hypothetical protein [Clostridium sp. CF012]
MNKLSIAPKKYWSFVKQLELEVKFKIFKRGRNTCLFYGSGYKMLFCVDKISYQMETQNGIEDRTADAYSVIIPLTMQAGEKTTALL